MGTTFTNLQIKTEDHEVLVKLLPSELYCLQTAEEWFTVLEKDSRHDFKRMTSLGRRLSKAVEGPVLVVQFFDDDIFELYLLVKGKTLGSYRANASGNFCMKSTAFPGALDLSPKEAQAFRYLIKQELSPSESIHWLSRLFGARLYVDKGLMDEEPKLWHKDTAAILTEIAAEKKAVKVDNQTDLILSDEVLGMDIYDCYSCVDDYMDRHNRILRISLLNNDGTYDFSRITCFQELDGHFVKVHEYQYPGDVFSTNDMRIWMDYEYHTFHTTDREGFNLGDDTIWFQWEPVISQDRRVPNKQLRDFAHLPEWSPATMGCRNRRGYDFHYLNGILKKIDAMNSGPKFSRWKVVAEYRYEEDINFWWDDSTASPCIADDMIVVMRVQRNRQTAEKVIDVRFFDRDLKLMRKEQIAVDVELPYPLYYCYDSELDTLFLGRLSVNLKTHEIVKCSAKIKDGYVLNCMDRKKHVFMLTGHSLYVLSPDMKLLSHHMLKGTLKYYYTNSRGNLCMITGCDPAENVRQLKSGAGLRTYEVTGK